MKVLCERDRLREALQVVSSVIPVKSTRPAIENVYLAATNDALELVGTDLEVAVRYRIEDVKVEDPGTALIPARVATDFVRDLGGETLTLETRGESFHIENGADSCELTTMDPDEFPVVARFPESDGLRLLGETFTRLVQRTGFAAAREQGRYAMHGILMQVKDDSLEMVATDGRRLAVASSPIEENGSAGSRAIVPTKGMQLFCRVIDEPMERISLHFGENQLGMKTDKAEIFARLIGGEFPRYSAVIPAETENRVEADADLLGQKLRLVSNVTSQDMRAVKLKIDKGKMTIHGRSAAAGQATAHMEVDFKGVPSEISFNPDYIIDGLKNCELESVRLEFNERTSPGKFTLGENYIYIVMPITIDT